jgi:uncharacterized protein YdeI (YjbR/CyaY-like superfamily)
MQLAGLAEVERAKADSRCDNAYEGVRTIQVPDDLQAALNKNSKAAEFFKSLNSQNRYAILFRITTGVRPETRAKRIQQLTALLERGEELYPLKTTSPTLSLHPTARPFLPNLIELETFHVFPTHPQYA